VKELQSLCLNMRVLDEHGSEITLKNDESEGTFNFRDIMRDDGEYGRADKEFMGGGFSIKEAGDRDDLVLDDSDEGDEGDEIGLD
jgi:DNA-directed RNA polymerase subunit beta